MRHSRCRCRHARRTRAALCIRGNSRRTDRRAESRSSVPSPLRRRPLSRSELPGPPAVDSVTDAVATADSTAATGARHRAGRSPGPASRGVCAGAGRYPRFGRIGHNARGPPPAAIARTHAAGTATVEEKTDEHRRPEDHPHADHVEPPDRGRRGAGAGAPAHRVLAHRARGGRSLRRRVRHPRADARSGRDRHTRPRELHGGVGQPLPAPLPRRHDERGGHLHHQRSVDGHRAPQRLRADHPLLPSRQGRGTVLVHVAPHRHRRHRLRPRRDRRAHGGASTFRCSSSPTAACSTRP